MSSKKSKSQVKRITIQKKKVKQTAIDLETGKQTEVDAEDAGMTDEELGLESEIERDSQAKVVAELVGIVLKPQSRVFTLRIVSPAMIKEMNRIYASQKEFMMKFRVPTAIENGEVEDWKEVEFATRLVELSLKGDKATCKGNITHKGAIVMSELIGNWKEQMEFFLDGVQQSIF